ncbi:hypothetical protein BC939DRAFT_41130 [Gamsiella multidivaricata]|uniref:uncharacterized protein n=1 Tax=Gamsiella multidivaricata TaxID=101098 RepID=UPI00221F199A|nr:uncharacterized protein BC939DRAFT_41130 [Gamsiella multidivaricata]KAI7816577.1 hypothetical protein BC939DRAFT_41130 [Gamsiella multidivaricata]
MAASCLIKPESTWGSFDLGNFTRLCLRNFFIRVRQTSLNLLLNSKCQLQAPRHSRLRLYSEILLLQRTSKDLVSILTKVIAPLMNAHVRSINPSRSLRSLGISSWKVK